MNRIGFCCLMSDSSKNEAHKVGRTFTTPINLFKDKEKGFIQTQQKILDNIKGTFNIINYCKRNNVTQYRLSSSIFPMMGLYEFEELPKYKEIVTQLSNLGKYIRNSDIRVSFHPDHFCKMASEDNDLLQKTIKVLDFHSLVLDLMGYPADHTNHINIHIGGSYGNKLQTLKRFSENLHLLQPNTRNRLTVENDDISQGYTVYDLYRYIDLPIVIDTFHHSIHNITIDSIELTLREAFEMAHETWHPSIIPVAHHSSSAKVYEDPLKRNTAHANFIYERFNSGSLKFDVEIEAKHKELAVLLYLKQFK